MPTPAEVRQVVEQVVGTKGDDTVFEYVVSILEDGEFEFGSDGEEAFDAFGAVLVRLHLDTMHELTHSTSTRRYSLASQVQFAFILQSMSQQCTSQRTVATH